MSKRKRHIVSEELLFRYFVEEVSPDEQEMVLYWKDLSLENQQNFERCRIFFIDVHALKSVGQVALEYDVEKAWSNTFRPKKGTDTSRNDGLYDFLKIAATILLVVGAGWLAYQLTHKIENTELSASGDIQSVDLPDGSHITLNKNSQLIYTSEFGDKERRVKLKGEAYFDVKHNPDQLFVIETGEIQVKVLGTSFNINNSASDSVVVTVDTGRVQMIVSDKEEILTPGFKGIYYRSSQLLVKLETNKIGMQNYWRTKALTFQATPLSEVLGALQAVYDTKIETSNANIVNCKISVDFEEESLENVLNIIGETLNLVWSKKDGVYLLAGDGCSD